MNNITRAKIDTIKNHIRDVESAQKSAKATLRKTRDVLDRSKLQAEISRKRSELSSLNRLRVLSKISDIHFEKLFSQVEKKNKKIQLLEFLNHTLNADQKKTLNTMLHKTWEFDV